MESMWSRDALMGREEGTALKAAWGKALPLKKKKVSTVGHHFYGNPAGGTQEQREKDHPSYIKGHVPVGNFPAKEREGRAWRHQTGRKGRSLPEEEGEDGNAALR